MSCLYEQANPEEAVSERKVIHSFVLVISII
jgi:hypothetical protein